MDSVVSDCQLFLRKRAAHHFLPEALRTLEKECILLGYFVRVMVLLRDYHVIWISNNWKVWLWPVFGTNSRPGTWPLAEFWIGQFKAKHWAHCFEHFQIKLKTGIWPNLAISVCSEFSTSVELSSGLPEWIFKTGFCLSLQGEVRYAVYMYMRWRGKRFGLRSWSVLTDRNRAIVRWQHHASSISCWVGDSW